MGLLLPAHPDNSLYGSGNAGGCVSSSSLHVQPSRMEKPWFGNYFSGLLALGARLLKLKGFKKLGMRQESSELRARKRKEIMDGREQSTSEKGNIRRDK